MSMGVIAMADETMIFPDSPIAASRQTVTGWISRDGFFCGDGPDAERNARWRGATHSPCKDCGKPANKHYTLCTDCRDKKAWEKFKAAPREAWDGYVLLYSDSTNRYFQDVEDVDEYCADNECSPDSLRLYLCEPNYGRELDASFFEDDLPSEDEGEVPEEIQTAIDAFNAAVKAYGKPLSWSPTRTAALLPVAASCCQLLWVWRMLNLPSWELTTQIRYNVPGTRMSNREITARRRNGPHTNTVYKTLPNRVRILRLEAGLTLAETANLIGCTETAINGLEKVGTGVSDARRIILREKLSEILNRDIRYEYMMGIPSLEEVAAFNFAHRQII